MKSHLPTRSASSRTSALWFGPKAGRLDPNRLPPVKTTQFPFLFVFALIAFCALEYYFDTSLDATHGGWENNLGASIMWRRPKSTPPALGAMVRLCDLLWRC
ncbi:hypothetical protein L596_017431 [Steinernema carpocapsae]|uniref:Uncharacterized protein n=1 Tax=Steinernema carpocapsae TaxID=34508 RepID=A0A4U5N1Y5_STECR|nr:hypothetical protein L596_017431 [Steinernema carpocapsae]